MENLQKTEGNAAFVCGSTLPDQLRIVDGVLVCSDGTDTREYLKRFALSAKIDAETPVVLMRRDGHENDRKNAWMMRNWGS